MRHPQLCSDALLVDRQVAYFDLAPTALVAAMLRVGSWA
jgi:hypothetical protein